MEEFFTILEINTGKELRGQFDNKNLSDSEVAIVEKRTQEMENPYFNFITKIFYNKDYE